MGERVIGVAKDTGELFHRGLTAHREGHLLEAGRLYRQVLDLTPNHADALHLLGVIKAGGPIYALAGTCLSMHPLETPGENARGFLTSPAEAQPM